MIEVSDEEVEGYRGSVEEDCPQLDHGFTKDELRLECVERTEDGYCQALGQECVLI